MSDDPRIALAHQVPMLELVDRLAIPGLVRTGGELVGPCPGCGGKDRFSINPRKDVIFCRRCDAKGDQIALVQLVLGLDFMAALEWLVGARQELTPQQLAEQERKANEHRRAREADAETGCRFLAKAERVQGPRGEAEHERAERHQRPS